MKEIKEKKKEIHDQRRMKPEDKLRRLERIEQTDSMRHLKGYDVNRAKRLEDFEIKTNAKGFERRKRGEGLDRGTEQRVKHEKIKQQKKYKRDH